MRRRQSQAPPLRSDVAISGVIGGGQFLTASVAQATRSNAGAPFAGWVASVDLGRSPTLQIALEGSLSHGTDRRTVLTMLAGPRHIARMSQRTYFFLHALGGFGRHHQDDPEVQASLTLSGGTR